MGRDRHMASPRTADSALTLPDAYPRFTGPCRRAAWAGLRPSVRLDAGRARLDDGVGSGDRILGGQVAWSRGIWQVQRGACRDRGPRRTSHCRNRYGRRATAVVWRSRHQGRSDYSREPQAGGVLLLRVAVLDRIPPAVSGLDGGSCHCVHPGGIGALQSDRGNWLVASGGATFRPRRAAHGLWCVSPATSCASD